jgi:hypothetical protein
MSTQSNLLSYHQPYPKTKLPHVLLGFMLPFRETPTANPQEVSLPNEWPAQLQLPAAPVITDLRKELIALCLHNPYWSDFRLLNHFSKRQIKLTMGELQALKSDCCVNNAQSICYQLLRQAQETKRPLNSWQISFVGKIVPEFRDRDLTPTHPGELLVYDCLFGRIIGDMGRIYVHIFVDMFNGYALGGISRQRSVAAGLDVLAETVLPIYRSHYTAVQSIIHSSHNLSDIKELDRLMAMDIFASLNLSWQHTRRLFGVTEKLAQSMLRNNFFQISEEHCSTFFELEDAFYQWLAKYNATNRLLQYRQPELSHSSPAGRSAIYQS